MAKVTVPEPADGKLLTVAELAVYFDVSVQTIRAWAHDDQMALPHGRFGRHIRFDRTEIQEWIDERWRHGRKDTPTAS
jgi:excisionase family DNA binding protein